MATSKAFLTNIILKDIQNLSLIKLQNMPISFLLEPKPVTGKIIYPINKCLEFN